MGGGPVRPFNNGMQLRIRLWVASSNSQTLKRSLCSKPWVPRRHVVCSPGLSWVGSLGLVGSQLAAPAGQAWAKLVNLGRDDGRRKE